MKYLKEYSFFKKKEGIDINIIRDILLDLEDIGFKCETSKDHIDSFKLKGFEDPFVKNNLFIKIEKSNQKKNTEENFFNTSKIKECVSRVFEYVKQTNVEISNIEYEYRVGIFENSIKSNVYPNMYYTDYLIIQFSIKKKFWQKR
jgi:hypothetical protein